MAIAKQEQGPQVVLTTVCCQQAKAWGVPLANAIHPKLKTGARPHSQMDKTSHQEGTHGSAAQQGIQRSIKYETSKGCLCMHIDIDSAVSHAQA